MKNPWVLMVATWVVSLSFAHANSRPNIVLIVADDLGYADLGFQGCKDIPTPHLDALAKRAVRCTQGYVSHPFCSPTRAGMLTGRYQQRFGHENNPAWLPENADVGLPLSETTIADRLGKAGYDTIAVGKWHLGAHPSFHPNRRGFGTYFGLLGGGHQYFDHNQFKTNPARAKAEYFIPLVRNDRPVEETEYLTDALAREAVAQIQAKRTKPFFMYLAFNAPHTPLQAPAKVLERTAKIADEKRRTYGAMVCALDDAVGRVVEAIQAIGATDDTLIFFLSDNGGPTGVTNCSNTPLRAGKGALYEGGIRVPFLVVHPKSFPKGRDHSGVVTSLDIVPTALDYAGIERPTGLDGISLRQALADKAPGSGDDTAVTRFWRTGGGTSWAVRKGAYKLVHPPKGEVELYDISRDPGETKNLASEQRDRLRDLQQMYQAWNKELIDPKWQSPQQKKK